MLTRFKVSGFKNLVDVDVRFGPFTCIAGANGVGKSNLFDAIKFLGLTGKDTLRGAALSVRGSETGQGAFRDLFHKVGGTFAPSMTLAAVIEVGDAYNDDLNEVVKANDDTAEYQISLGLHPDYHKQNHLSPFIITGEKFVCGVPIIELTSAEFDVTSQHSGTIKVVSEKKPMRESLIDLEGRRKSMLASTSVLAELYPSAFVTTSELAKWHVLQVETSAIRDPQNENFDTMSTLGHDGSHLAATLHRIAENYRDEDGKEAPERIYAQAASRLHDLIGGDVQSIRVDDDDKRELYTLYLTDRNGTEHPARSLSDGTLRFLALITLWLDPEATGVFCIEEPENGIHPARLPALVRLLQDIAVNPEYPVGPDNPLRQVIVVTHSPEFVKLVPEDSLLLARTRTAVNEEGTRYSRAEFVPLAGTWRDTPDMPRTAVASINEMIAYLDPFRMAVYRSDKELAMEDGDDSADKYPVRVADRPELRPLVEGK